MLIVSIVMIMINLIFYINFKTSQFLLLLTTYSVISSDLFYIAFHSFVFLRTGCLEGAR